MTTSFRLPDLGEGVHEAEILAIPVTSGQAIKEGDIIFEIETDKAAVEIPSPFTATVRDILVQEGDMTTVGDVLMTFTTSADLSRQQKKGVTTAGQQSPDPEPEKQRKRVVPASPSTRRIARELEVDLNDLTPSAPSGVVSREDVEIFARQRETVTVKEHNLPTSSPANELTALARTSLPDFTRWGPVERLPFRSIRRATAKKMISSWNQIPHVHCQDTVDITELETFRQKHKTAIEEADGRLTMTIFAMKAVATALKNFPPFNASLDLESQEIIIKRYFHIGIAMDTEKGLMVPVIRDVDRKSIKELAKETDELINKVRQGKQNREDMQGGTFTITNAGALGGSQFSAIINHPEVAILGLGQGRMQPAVITNDRGRHEIVPRLIMPIILCFDHRVIDGGDAIRFLRLVIDALEDPDELLITMI